ncbi:MAG: hypothetical protein PHW84_01880 [Methanosarcina sp.]|nr:hypothetical protein [Methanosarcina sp.]
MPAGQIPGYVLRGECEKNRDGLRCDLKELILQERDDRKDGEQELNRAIEKVDGKIDAINSKMTGLLVTIVAGILIFLLECIAGKF